MKQTSTFLLNDTTIDSMVMIKRRCGAVSQAHARQCSLLSASAHVWELAQKKESHHQINSSFTRSEPDPQSKMMYTLEHLQAYDSAI
jgi:hypothetical protein